MAHTDVSVRALLDTFRRTGELHADVDRLHLDVARNAVQQLAGDQPAPPSRPGGNDAR